MGYLAFQPGFVPSVQGHFATANACATLRITQLSASLIELLLFVQLAVEQRVNMKVAPNGKFHIKPPSKRHAQFRVQPRTALVAAALGF